MPSSLTSQPEQARWRNLLGRIRSLQIELERANASRRAGLAGNPGAPSAAIRIAELRLGESLPPSYRDFLLFTDGWANFFESADLLGTADIGRPSCLDRSLSPVAAPPNRLCSVVGFERLIPFGASPDGKTLFTFDPNSRSVTGEMQVVAWIGGLGLDCRNFTEFLATVLQLCRTEAAGQRSPEQTKPSSPLVARSERLRKATHRSETIRRAPIWRSVG